MAPQVLASFVRIVTHPRVYVHPSFTSLCERARVNGNLVQDAWFAALAIESGAEWVTFDRDYARFPGLRWRAPFQ